MNMRCIVVIVLLLGWAHPAAGQMALEVAPLRVEMTADPGSTSTQAVSLTNVGTVPLRVRARLSDWSLARDGSPQFELSAGSAGEFSATAWVRLAPPEQVVAPGARVAVRFTLAVPADTPAAGYRTSILFDFAEEAPGIARRSEVVSVRSRIATLVYLTVGQPLADVELVDLRDRRLPESTQVIAVIRNTGRRTVRTRGTLVLTGAGGAEVRRVAVPDVPVLPESEREIGIPVIDAELGPLPAGEYRVEVRIDAGMPAILVGESVLKVGG